MYIAETSTDNGDGIVIKKKLFHSLVIDLIWLVRHMNKRQS